MKRTVMDKIVGFISPIAELKRIKARTKADLILRGYDAAKTFKTDDWSSADASTGANDEIGSVLTTLRDRSRDAVRNNPYASKAVTVITNATVGWGIEANITGTNDAHTQKLREAWREWADTTLCDADGRHTFAGLQSLVMRSVVESGEVLSFKTADAEANKIKILESDFLDSAMNEKGVKQGIVLKDGKRTGYYIFNRHPGETEDDKAVSELKGAELIDHIFRQDRPGQLRGVPWSHNVINILEDLKEFQRATLIKQKVSACLVGVISGTSDSHGLSDEQRKAKREANLSFEPASFYHMEDGESVTFSNPPTVSGYNEFVVQMLRMLSNGYGISFEALTNDYSRINFSSGRMGNMEMRRNVEAWRYNMLIPQFCEPAFKHFLEWAQTARGAKAEGAKVQWVPPAWSMIDPIKELTAASLAIRNGLTTTPNAIREQGFDPDQVLQEQIEWNARLDEAGLILDSDPRNITKAGQAQAVVAPDEEKESNGEEE